MISINLLGFFVIWLVSYAGKTSGRGIPPRQIEPVIIPNHGSWNVSQKPFEATTHAAVPWFPQGGDAEQRTRKPFTKRANRVDKYHEKGLQKWEELQKLLKADPLHRDLPALSPDQLRQGGWDIEHACGQTPSQSDLAVLLRSDPGTPPDDFCFDVSARQKDYQGWETTDGIVFRNNYCPGYGGLEVIKAYKETTDDDGRKYVARTSWSNVTWALWNFNCEDENQVAGLSWLAHKNIANKDTLEILDEMREDNEPETTERPGSGTYLAYTLKPDFFFALLASPNGNGVFYLLKDHINTLRKTIAEIRVYQQVSWDDDEEEYDDEDLPEMVFIFSKTQK